MNPLRIARSLREDYLRLLRTAFQPRQERLREAFEQEIAREGFLTREPFIALASPHQYGRPLTELLEETRRRFAPIADHPFAHQAEACRRILRGEPVVVATGTGSGKTEAFLMPIVDHCLRHRDEPGPKAVLVYPMNALANDQRNRIRVLLTGTGISFGRYTGETQLMGARPPEAPEEERVIRGEFRANPPDLFLTNYQMLEYLLLRGDGREIFRDHRVRFIVLDEVHTYHGALGVDVACLLRRLRAALQLGQPNSPPPLFIGTSATLLSGGTGDPRVGVAAFFSSLTGQETPPEAVVTESPTVPVRPPNLRFSPPPDITEAELHAFDPEDSGHVLVLARKLGGVPPNALVPLEEAWARTPLPYLVLDWFRRPRSLEEIVDLLGQEEGRRLEQQGVTRDGLRREVEAALLVGPCLPDDHPLRLRPRVHRFLRGLARFWRCTDPGCGRLLSEGVETCDRCGARALPLALCRTCGWDFFMVRAPEDGAGPVAPWPGRVSGRRSAFLFDPPVAPIEVEPEEDPQGGEEGSDDDAPAVEAEDEVVEAPPAARADAYLCPRCLSLSENPGMRACVCPTNDSLRPVRILRGRGTRCPICRSRYGRFDVITPVSLGNSLALTHVARMIMRGLPADRRKLLVFCDSRQDAAHQARFIAGIEDHLRLRRVVYRLLRSDGQPHDFSWLIEGLLNAYVEQGVIEQPRSPDARRRATDRLAGAMLTEFVIAPHVRAGLERLGLVRIRYAGLEDATSGEEFDRICRSQSLAPEAVAQAIPHMLDLLRTRRAVAHDALRFRLRRGDQLSQRYGIEPGRQVGLPVAFREPGQRPERARNYKLETTWNATGNPAGVQRLWRQLLGDHAGADSLAAVLRWLEHERLLVISRIGQNANETEGFQVAPDILLFEVGRSFARCSVCGRVVANEPAGGPCIRTGCEGRLEEWEGPLASENLNALLIAADQAPPLIPAEHSAAITDEERARAEQGFLADPPRFNVLACTPTLELGVNIGDLEAVALRNVPPNPANYAQRTGRTGRRSRMGIAAGFARNTPHDGYFFDHPDEIIAGAIPPPRFNLNNLETVARHVRSLVVEEARIDFPSNLTTLLGEEGQLLEPNASNLIRRLEDARPNTRQRAHTVFHHATGAVADFGRWLEGIVEVVPGLVRHALIQRGHLIEEAVRKMREHGQRVRQSPREEEAEKGYRILARKLREDHKYAYLPRVLAEAGILPGYAFPGDPGSLSLAFDPEPIFAGRLQAQREYAPGQIVYARGHRWRVGGIALNRPGSLAAGHAGYQFEFTECPDCGLANRARGANQCARCGAELAGSTQVAWDVGAFQAWPAEVEVEAEEERQFHVYDIRVHPQRDVGGMGYGLGPWRMELREQEGIWWVNHGSREVPDDGGVVAQATGFHLCPTCGELVPDPPAPSPSGRRGRVPRGNRDPRANQDEHARRCNGVPAHFALGHQGRADTLRLIVPGLAGLGEEGVAWAWSFGAAVMQGAIRHFGLDEDDLDAVVLTRRTQSGEEVVELAWVDTVLGGSGILREMAAAIPAVASAAVRHLEGHDCPRSCYRCLRTYRNQRVHRLLNWRLVLSYLRAAAGETIHSQGPLSAAAHVVEGPEWEEARREGCGSPQELRLLRAIREAGLPEPEKQHEVRQNGRLITRADFAYLAQRVLIYVDSLAFHSSIRQRIHDTRQTNDLQNMGYRVFRFLAREILQAPDVIRSALE